LATKGYPEGSVGNAVHRSIGAIYLTLGTVGEEQIGIVFNSDKAKALYNDPVTSSSGRRIAEIEYAYWDGVKNENRLSIGGNLGVLFNVDKRVWLQEQFARLPDFDVVHSLVRSIRQWFQTTLGGGARRLAAKLLGDPHFTSFDGERFDFQGRGQFVLSRALDADGFALETQLVDQSTFRDATMMRAIAVRANRFAPVLRVVSERVGELSVSIGPLRVWLDAAPYRAFGVSIVQSSPSRVTIEYDCGVVVSCVAWTRGVEPLIWQTSVQLPGEMAAQVVGLLGNADGARNDDRTMIDWRVDEATSLFAVASDTIIDDQSSTNPPAMPAAIDTATPTQQAAARAACATIADEDLKAFCQVDHVLSDGVMQRDNYAVSVQEAARLSTLESLEVTRINATHVAVVVNGTNNALVDVFAANGTSSAELVSSVSLVDNIATVELAAAQSAVLIVRAQYVAPTKTATRVIDGATLIARLHATVVCSPHCPANYCGDNRCGGTCDCQLDPRSSISTTTTVSSSSSSSTSSTVVTTTTDAMSTQRVVSIGSSLSISCVLALICSSLTLLV
jgi:hypothetical protein